MVPSQRACGTGIRRGRTGGLVGALPARRGADRCRARCVGPVRTRCGAAGPGIGARIARAGFALNGSREEDHVPGSGRAGTRGPDRTARTGPNGSVAVQHGQNRLDEVVAGHRDHRERAGRPDDAEQQEEDRVESAVAAAAPADRPGDGADCGAGPVGGPGRWCAGGTRERVPRRAGGSGSRRCSWRSASSAAGRRARPGQRSVVHYRSSAPPYTSKSSLLYVYATIRTAYDLPLPTDRRLRRGAREHYAGAHRRAHHPASAPRRSFLIRHRKVAAR